MTSVLPPDEVRRLLALSGMAPVPESVVLGMPHLSMFGLSETWLLKECGHRHWNMLARAAGRATPDFRNPAGEPIYAAFLAVSVRDAAFDTVRENDRLMFDADLAKTSRSQFTSFHRLSVAGRAVGEIVMTSTFVRRTQRGDNRTIARIDVPALRNLALNPAAAGRVAETAALRADNWGSHLGFAYKQAAALDRFTIAPCPGQDFNGAGFLYCASFQAFVDRAEWAFFGSDFPHTTTHRRDLVFRGNVDPGDRVAVELMQFRKSGGDLFHWCRLADDQNSRTIAEIFTVRGCPENFADRSR
jgi:probable biosynthetic protein (TIGR04099 family)